MVSRVFVMKQKVTEGLAGNRVVAAGDGLAWQMEKVVCRITGAGEHWHTGG